MDLGRYLEEGTALHHWLLFLAQGQDPEDPPDERIASRVEGIRKFLGSGHFKFLDGEKPLVCDLPLFACTPDVWGHWEGEPCLVEMKRSAKAKWHPLQTAAQALALKQAGFPVKHRIGLYLRDGDYALDFHTDREDFNRWSVIVNAFHAKTFYC